MTQKIKPLTRLEKLADLLMVPIMQAIMWRAGFPEESPQQTHFWNNWKGNYCFDPVKTVRSTGTKDALPATGLGRHLTHRDSGWKQYLVLQRKDRDFTSPFHVGWVGYGVSGISRIESCGQVRVLEGPHPVTFVGFNPNGSQIALEIIGQSRLGDAKWQDVPLL